MGQTVLTDAYIAINGTAFSDHIDNLAMTDSANQIEFTAFGPSAYRTYGQGLKDATITCDFFSDFAAASVHATLQPLYASGGTFLVEVRPTSAGVSSSNPRGSMIARLYDYPGFGGKVGDASKITVTFHNAGTTGLTWGTA